jgi:hypothetical protein
MVTIPLESRVLTTNVFAVDPKQPWQEPAASIMAVHFDLEDGSEWYVEKERVSRGATINYKRQEATNPILEKQTSTTFDSMPENAAGSRPGQTRRPSTPSAPSPRDRGAKPPEPKKKEGTKQIDIVSEVCVLDMKGGEALYRMPSAAMKLPELKSPGKVMVLEPSGNMLIRTINSDLLEVETIKNPTATASFGGDNRGSGSYMGDSY